MRLPLVSTLKGLLSDFACDDLVFGPGSCAIERFTAHERIIMPVILRMSGYIIEYKKFRVNKDYLQLSRRAERLKRQESCYIAFIKRKFCYDFIGSTAKCRSLDQNHRRSLFQ